MRNMLAFGFFVSLAMVGGASAGQNPGTSSQETRDSVWNFYRPPGSFVVQRGGLGGAVTYFGSPGYDSRQAPPAPVRAPRARQR